MFYQNAIGIIIYQISFSCNLINLKIFLSALSCAGNCLTLASMKIDFEDYVVD